MNVQRVKRRVQRLNEAVQSAAERTAQETALAAETEAKMLAPVQTGRLRESIRKTGEGLQAQVETQCEYAQIVEMGSSSHAPQPFLAPTMKTQRAEWMNRARRALGETVERR